MQEIESNSMDYRTWSIDTCIICDIKNDEDWVPYRLLFNDEEIKSELLYENEYFFIIADIAPLAEGHYLINYNQHISSFSCVDKKILDELGKLKRALRQILKDDYGELIFFEHGAGLDENGGCCINHAHLHVLPANFDILSRIREDFVFEEKDIYDLLLLPNTRGYLYYEDTNGKVFISENKDRVKIPSQYFRRIIAAENKEKTVWNWRDQVKYADLLNTKGKILQAQRKLRSKYSVLLPH